MERFAIFLTLLSLLACVSAQQCKTLTNTLQTRLTNPCVGAVTYSYFVPATSSDAAILAAVKAQLNKNTLKLVPVACQSALRTMVCASAYLKCTPGLALANPATYNYQIYSHDLNITKGVPFQRPCQSVCNNVNTQCAGFYTLMNGVSNCSATFDYSGGTVAAKPRKYDYSNATAQCHVPTAVPIAPTKETYIHAGGGGICSGYVTTVYAPPGNAVNSSYAVLQRPTAMQNVIENGLAAQLANLPPWMEPDCKFNLLRYLCMSAFLAPQTMTFLSVFIDSGVPAGVRAVINAQYPGLLATTVDFPRYPHQEYCEEYADTCAGFIVRANRAALNPACSGTTPTNALVRRFPTLNQTIANQTKTIGATAYNIVFRTSPYNAASVSTSSAAYSAVCPYGFVIPEHPDDSDVQSVSGTACAIACKNPVYTPVQWRRFGNIGFRVPLVGTILSGLLLVYLLVAERSRDHMYLIIIYAALTFVVSLASVIMAGKTVDERFCYDNALGQSQKYDGVDAEQCVVQGVLITYTFLATCSTLFVLSVDILVKLTEKLRVFVKNNQILYYSFQVFFVFLLPLIPTIIAGAWKYYGFTKTLPWCSIMLDPLVPLNADISLVMLPVLIVICMTMAVLIVTVVVKFCLGYAPVSTFDDSHAPAAATNPAEIALNNYSTAVAAIFTVFAVFMVFWPAIASKIAYYHEEENQKDAFKEWGSCVFQNYDGVDDYSWQNACGYHSDPRPRFGLNSWLIFSYTGQSILVGSLYFIAFGVRLVYPLGASEAPPAKVAEMVAVTPDSPSKRQAAKEEEASAPPVEVVALAGDGQEAAV